MEKIFQLNNLHRSPFTTIIGTVIILIALYQQFQEAGDWMNTGVAIAIGLFLCFLPDSKKKHNANCHDDPKGA